MKEIVLELRNPDLAKRVDALIASGGGVVSDLELVAALLRRLRDPATVRTEDNEGETLPSPRCIPGFRVTAWRMDRDGRVEIDERNLMYAVLDCRLEMRPTAEPMPEPTKRIPIKALLHLTFCRDCFTVPRAEDRQSSLCSGCIIMQSEHAAEAAREFVAKEQEQ